MFEALTLAVFETALSWSVVAIALGADASGR
jgi:hypothetical protein